MTETTVRPDARMSASGRGRQSADNSDWNPNTAVTSPQDVNIPRLTRYMFPRLTDEEWKQRGRTLRRRHAKYFQDHPRELKAFAQPRPASVANIIEKMNARTRRDERRQQRRANGFV